MTDTNHDSVPKTVDGGDMPVPPPAKNAAAAMVTGAEYEVTGGDSAKDI